jgi:beta-phosphoglucomutase
MTSPTAFIFDLDGVLTDTAEFHYRAWKRLADEYHLPFTREDNEQLRGVDRRESLTRLLKGKVVPPEQFDAWLILKNDYYRAFLTDVSPAYLLPGVERFLTESKALDLKLGVASASKNANEVLAKLGISAFFDAIGDGFSVHNAKPAPDLFVWVAGRLNALPMDTVIFEDGEAGIDAAIQSGMHSVGIGPVERVGRADIVLHGFADITAAEVIARLS